MGRRQGHGCQDRQGHHQQGWQGLRILGGVGLVLILAACGKADTTANDAAAVAAGIARAADAAAAAAESAAQSISGAVDDLAAPEVGATSSAVAVPPVTRDVGKTGWYDGFAITVDTITAEPGYGSQVDLTATMTYRNLRTESDSPARGSIEVDGLVVDGYFDSPSIPGGAKARGSVTYTVVPDAPMTPAEAIDRTELVWGDAADNQTMIPLAVGADVTSVEPRTLTLSGTLQQGQIIVEVVSGALAPSYRSGEKGKSLLDVRVKLTCAPDCSAAGWNTGVEQFSITGPDGNSVVADSRSEYCCDALYPTTVSDSERNIVTFVVASPGTGTYTLTYDNKNLSSTGTAAATFTFTA